MIWSDGWHPYEAIVSHGYIDTSISLLFNSSYGLIVIGILHVFPLLFNLFARFILENRSSCLFRELLFLPTNEQIAVMKNMKSCCTALRVCYWAPYGDKAYGAPQGTSCGVSLTWVHLTHLVLVMARKRSWISFPFLFRLVEILHFFYSWWLILRASR